MEPQASFRVGKLRLRGNPPGRAARRRRSPRLWLEVLENRALLAGVPVLLANVNAGTEASDPGQFTQVGPVVFFTANDDVNGRELWKTDGTAAGTMLVKDIRP